MVQFIGNGEWAAETESDSCHDTSRPVSRRNQRSLDRYRTKCRHRRSRGNAPASKAARRRLRKS